MVTLIIFIFAFLLTGFVLYKMDSLDLESVLGSLVSYALVYGLLMLIGRMELADNNKFDSFEYKDQPIESLGTHDGMKINGSFILGCGSVSGTSGEYYVSYARFSQGLLRIKTDAYECYVLETDSVPPVIKNYWVRKIKEPYNSKWFWNRKRFVGDWRKYEKYFVTEEFIRDKIVIVPKNTVKVYQQFQIED